MFDFVLRLNRKRTKDIGIWVKNITYTRREELMVWLFLLLAGNNNWFARAFYVAIGANREIGGRSLYTFKPYEMIIELIKFKWKRKEREMNRFHGGGRLQRDVESSIVISILPIQEGVANFSMPPIILFSL